MDIVSAKQGMQMYPQDLEYLSRDSSFSDNKIDFNPVSDIIFWTKYFTLCSFYLYLIVISYSCSSRKEKGSPANLKLRSVSSHQATATGKTAKLQFSVRQITPNESRINAGKAQPSPLSNFFSLKEFQPLVHSYDILHYSFT